MHVFSCEIWHIPKQSAPYSRSQISLNDLPHRHQNVTINLKFWFQRPFEDMFVFTTTGKNTQGDDERQVRIKEGYDKSALFIREMYHVWYRYHMDMHILIQLRKTNWNQLVENTTICAYFAKPSVILTYQKWSQHLQLLTFYRQNFFSLICHILKCI